MAPGAQKRLEELFPLGILPCAASIGVPRWNFYRRATQFRENDCGGGAPAPPGASPRRENEPRRVAGPLSEKHGRFPSKGALIQGGHCLGYSGATSAARVTK